MIIRSKAPLRLGFAGGGTDVSPYSDIYGGYTLNATINLYAYCILIPHDQKIVFSATDIEINEEYSLTDHLDIARGLQLHKGVYLRIMQEFNKGINLPVSITTYSDSPPGSGLGTSSTIVVAMIKAYVEWLKLPLGEYEIAHLAFQIEREQIGLSGGKQDQYAATFGGVNLLEFHKDSTVIVNPLRIKPWVQDELESSLILYFTGVSRESDKIIKKQSENVHKNKLESIQAMHDVKNSTIEMKNALLQGDLVKFATILGTSWLAKKNMAEGISTELIEKIFEKAIKYGAISGKVSGAGGGGFVMLYVDPLKRVQVIKALEKFGGKIVNFNFVNEGVRAWRI